MSESTEPPATVEPEVQEHQELQQQPAQENDESKDVSGDSASLASTEITEDDRDDIRGPVETTDPNRTLEFNKQEVEVESSEKESEKQVQEVVQEELEQHSKISVSKVACLYMWLTKLFVCMNTL